MSSRTKTCWLTIKVTAPKVMTARQIRREIRDRITEYAGHYAAFDFDLNDRDTDPTGGPKLRVALSYRKQP